MAHGAVFYPEEKLIVIESEPTNGITTLDAQRDFYSFGKERWQVEHNGFTFPFFTIGGEPISDDVSVGAYFFLDTVSGWRIRPYEADHEFRLNGNLYSIDPTVPMFTPTLGAFSVSIFIERSSLTQMLTVEGGNGESVWTTAEKNLILDDVSLIRKIEEGRWKIVNNQMIFYDSDGVTPLKTFNLFDKEGAPTEVEPFERNPV